MWRETRRFSQEAGTMMFKPFRNVIAVSQTELVRCKHCGQATDVVRYGLSRNREQKYLCRKCRKVFLDNKATLGMRTPADAIGAALGMFYEGLSFDAIRRQLRQIYHLQPSTSTIYAWVTRYSRKAATLAATVPIHVGNVWVVDESVLKIGRANLWFWDVIDEETRFLLASHISEKRTTQDVVTVMSRAEKHAGIAPRFVISDRLAAYLDGVERVFGSDTFHLRSQGFTGIINTNLIERFHGTLKGRTKVMRGMQNHATARIILDGWLVHYNWLRPHESLGGKTPAISAGARMPFISWADIARGRT